MPLQNDQIWYEGQPIALVVGETLEQAQYAASRISAEYTSEPASVDYLRNLDHAAKGTSFAELDTSVGNLARGLAEAEIKIEELYFTSDRHHSPMEPSATIAKWRDGSVTLYDTTQWVWGVRAAISGWTLRNAPSRMRRRRKVVTRWKKPT